MSTLLMHANMILEGLWESETPIRPGHIERSTGQVVIRVVAEVRDDDRRDGVPVAWSRGYGGITPCRRARRTRVYLERSLDVRERRVR